MSKITRILIVALLITACEPPKPPTNPDPVPPTSKDFFYGVTITDPYDFEKVADSLGAHRLKVTARIVFDEFVKASEYAEVVPALAKKAFIMGELVDSFFVPKYSLKAYEDRAKEYLNAFKGNVNIWEVGNEINGEWLGPAAAVVPKLVAAHNVIKAVGGTTALTLYYNPNCWENKDNEMIPWVKKYLPTTLKNDTDFVLVSYYPYDCENYFPNAAEWENVFKQLAQIFPNSMLGIGESGSPRTGSAPHLPSVKQYLDYFYHIRPKVDRFIGGYFWWYYFEDMVSNIGQRNDAWKHLDKKLLKATPTVGP